MEQKIIQLLKRKIFFSVSRIFSDFIKNTKSTTIATRMGPKIDADIDEQLQTLDNVLQNAEDKH